MDLTIDGASLSELAAAFLQAAITLGLALLFVFLYRTYRRAYFGWFGLAWVLYTVRTTAIISFLLTAEPVWLYWHQVVTGWTALAILWAAWVFYAGPRFRTPYLIALLFPVLWSYVAIYRLDDFLLAVAPAVAFLSAATIWTGWVFWQHHKRVRSPVAAALALVFIAWGIHHLDYPFLRARGAWDPWGYYLDIMLALGVGGAMLVLVLEDLRRGLSALSSLSGRLQEWGPEDTALDNLLCHALELPGVTGCAMFGIDDSVLKFVHGVGSCAVWTGREPGDVAARTIRDAMTDGEPRVARNAVLDGEARPRAPYVAALPVFSAGRPSAALVLVGEAQDPFAALDTEFLLALGRQVGAALEGARLNAALTDRSRALERLASRMVDEHQTERKRLSRELHDETAQVFASVRLQLGVIRENAPLDLHPRLDRALELVDTGMKSIRSVTDSLRPPLLDELGLVPALRSLVEHFQSRTGLEVDILVGSELPVLPPAAELALYRALQEAMANVARHAGATRVDIVLETGNGDIALRVRDDGNGFSAERPRGGGLTGMSERLDAIGGSLVLEPRAGTGTELLVTIPFTPPHHD